jgi:hypothetical protein
MEPPRLLALFNQPPPKIPTGNRDVTSTPAQSLALLNDPFVSQQAEAWARRLTRQQHASVQDRVAAMFLTAYGREPTPRETDRWAQLIGDLSQQRGLAADQILQDLSVWKEAAHALLNTKEFIYLR